MSIIKDEGIVIRNRPLNEADRIVTILTRFHGKLEAVAKGARRPRSRFVASTLPFTQINLMLFEGKNMHNLSQAEIITSFHAVRDDLVKMAYASYWMELVESLLEIQQDAEKIYTLTIKALHRLIETDKPALFSRLFELRLADYLGWKPELTLCVACGKEISSPPFFFAGELGGMLCSDCKKNTAGILPISGEAWTVLNRLLNAGEGNSDKIEYTSQTLKDIAKLLCDFFQIQAGKKIKSFLFLLEVD